MWPAKSTIFAILVLQSIKYSSPSTLDYSPKKPLLSKYIYSFLHYFTQQILLSMYITGTFLSTGKININMSAIPATIQEVHSLVEKKDKG